MSCLGFGRKEFDVHLKVKRNRAQSWTVTVYDGDNWYASVSMASGLWPTLEAAIPYIASCCDGHHPAYTSMSHPAMISKEEPASG